MSGGGRGRRRGQGAAEFALVAPFFFLIIGGFLLFSLWMLNGLVIEGAARDSARFASASFGQYLSRLAGLPITFTASPDEQGTGFFSQLPDPGPDGSGLDPYDSSISSRFAVRNAMTASGYVDRLGWDWGILPDSTDQIVAAYQSTAGKLSPMLRGMFGGIPDGTLAHVCLLAVLPTSRNPDGICANESLSSYLVTTDGSISLEREPDIDFDPAPRYVRVELEVPLVRWKAIPLSGLFASDDLVYRIAATERLGRLEPACPIPTSEAAAIESGCGLLYRAP